MRNISKTVKFLSLIFATTLFLNIAVFAVCTSFVVSDSYNLSENIVFTNETIVDKNGSVHKSFVVDYTPSKDLSDISFLYGSNLNTRTSVTTLVNNNPSEDTPVAAMNADFFNMSTGLAESLVIFDGKLLTSDRGNYAFAFDSNGVPFIDKPEFTFNISMPNHNGTIIHYNKEFTEYGLYLYSGYYGNNTLINVSSVELVLFPYSEKLDYEQMAVLLYGEEGVPFDLYTIQKGDNDTDKLVLNERYRNSIEQFASENGYSLNAEYFYKNCSADVIPGYPVHTYVKEIRNNVEGKSLNIPEGCFVLAANAKTQAFKLEKVSVNDTVEISVNCNERFIGVQRAIGCGALIVDDGQVKEHNNLSHYAAANPRTAIGITEDSRIIMFGVDGRQGTYSKGLTLKQLSEEMIRLGCVKAANLDGGGSTVVKALLPYNKSFATVSKPSDGSERKVSNAVAFYNTQKPTGNLAYSYLISDEHLVLFNSVLRLGEPVFTDSSHYAVDVETIIKKSNTNPEKSDKNNMSDDAIIGELLGYSDATKTEETVVEPIVPEYNYHGFTYSVEKGKGFINNNIYTPDGYAGEVYVVSTSPDGYKNEAFRIISLSEIDKITVDFDKSFMYVGDSFDISADAYYKGFSVKGTDDCFFWFSDNERSLTVSEYGVISAKAPKDKVTLTVAFGQTSKKMEIEVRELPFTDISGNWARDNIIFLYEEGITNGELTEKGRMYFPSRAFSRNEFCVMLSRMLGLTIAVDTLNDNSSAFSDVQQDSSSDKMNDAFLDYESIPSWAKSSVDVLYIGGYLDGFEHKTSTGVYFDGSKNVTRREVVRFVGNLLEDAPDDYSFKFSDISNDDPDYQCIKNALYHGVFNGYLDGTLRLDNTLTRAEVSAVFIRLMEKM